MTSHARAEMARRGLDEATVEEVLARPEQRIEVRSGRVILQSRRSTEEGRAHLVRVFVDIDRRPPEVVTVYRTTKVSKYWREES